MSSYIFPIEANFHVSQNQILAYLGWATKISLNRNIMEKNWQNEFMYRYYEQGTNKYD